MVRGVGGYLRDEVERQVTALPLTVAKRQGDWDARFSIDTLAVRGAGWWPWYSRVLVVLAVFSFSGASCADLYYVFVQQRCGPSVSPVDFSWNNKF